MTAFSISGVSIPDSEMAREITQLVRDTESEMLFQHSIRVYFWGALSGKRQGLTFDPELLYAAAMFHDIGITSTYHHSKHRFEVDGANAARDFLAARGFEDRDLQKVWLAIALHTSPGIPQHLHAEAFLVQSGAGMDMTGRGYEDFTPEERQAVVGAHPRALNFGSRVIDTFYEGLKRRPGTTFGSFNEDFLSARDSTFERADICTMILHSPWQH